MTKHKLVAVGGLLLALAMSACPGDNEGGSGCVFPEVPVACDAKHDIYRNVGDKTMTVTVQATELCEEARGSAIYVTNDSGDDRARQEIPDDGTRHFTFSVKPGELIIFDCFGNEGDGECKYSLSAR